MGIVCLSQDCSLSNVEQLSSSRLIDTRPRTACGLGAVALLADGQPGPPSETSPLSCIENGVTNRTMHLLSAHCRVCKGDQFRTVPPEGWVERVVLPRLFLCPGRCIVCHKRRYLPTFQRWTAVPNSWR
jgi:hypothetical protein